MDKILFVTRPSYDDGTEYLSEYASLVLKEAEKLGIDKKDFWGEKVNKKEVEKFIEIKNPKLLFINGHGDNDVLCGHKDEIIFSSNNNISLLKDRIIYARACNAAVSLGKKATEGAGGCFIGYKYPFSFWIDNKWSAKPLNDKTAALYLLPSNEVVISLLKGSSTQRAYEKSKTMMVENMKKILKMEEKKEPGAMGMMQVLWNNYDGQIIQGNKEAHF
jgi:hypothetical protein